MSKKKSRATRHSVQSADDEFPPDSIATALREREDRLAQQVAAMQRLQECSTQLLVQDDPAALYEKIMDAAVAIMRSDYASMQMLYPERGSRGELRLLAFRGFNPEAAKFWEWVRADSESTCGEALRTGRRAIAPDVEKCDYMAGSEDLATSLQTGIHAVQTTPLISRSGRLLGMVSTHWRRPHEPSESDLGLLDVLARQAADLIERNQADEQLRRSERDLADFFENAAIGLHWVGPDGIILRANQAELDMLGYRRKEYVGRPIAEFHADRPVIDDILERLTRGEKLNEYPARLRCKDGSIRDVLINSSALFEDGKFVHTRCFTHDVTGRKAAEEALQEGEHRFRQMIDALPAAIYTTDAAGRLTHFNPAAVAFSGRVPELGTDEWCVSWRLYSADGVPMPHDECPMAIALKEGREIRGAEAIAERPDGTRAWFTPYPTLLRDNAGKIIGAVNMLVDITERKQAEQEEARLAAIVESSDDAIISKDLNSTIRSWNAGAQRLFGYTADEAIGQSVTMLMPPDRIDEEADILARIGRRENINHYETVRRRKDGSLVDISLTVSPIIDKHGRVVGASKIARDIAERKQAETTQQMLLNELNHRVKNTLASVQAIAQQTLARTQKPADFVASFDGRIQSLARVHTLLSATTWRGADLRDLIRDQVLSGPVDETRLTAWGPAVQLDSQTALHVALMLHELGTNACKYGALSTASGWVTVNWTTDDALHIQWVERGGPPVARPSRRGFGSTLIEQSARGQGGGAQMLCEAEGITWKITLPLRDRADFIIAPQIVRTPPPAASGEPGISLAGRRFLVIEDEALVGLDIVAGLEDADAQVEGPIGTPDKAIDAIERLSLDGALLDANLHGLPVDEIASALTRRNIPFVFVTGHGADGLPQAFRAAPILSKPFSRQQLVEAAARLVTSKSDVVRLRR